MLNTYDSTGKIKFSTVIAVDIKRSVCKCISDSGEVLSEVRWVVPMGGTDGTGLSVTPIESSRVVVDTSSGFPIIIGSIPSDGTTDVRRTNIGRQDVDEEDIADYSLVDLNGIIRGPGTPRDQRPGDSVFTSDTGGILGLLAGATSIIKSSPLAQIITTRIGDLVRVVSRNWEHFTDMDETYKVSIRGKVYSLRNIFRSPKESRDEKPSWTRIEGDVAYGETLGKGYAGVKKGSFPKEPNNKEDANVVIKEYTHADSVTSTMTQDISGNIKRSIHTGSTSNYWMTGDEFHWDMNGGGTFITGNSDGIEVNVEGASIIKVGSDGNITITNTGNTSIKTDGTLKVKAGDTDFDLGNTTFKTGTFSVNASGNATIKAPVIELN